MSKQVSLSHTHTISLPVFPREKASNEYEIGERTRDRKSLKGGKGGGKYCRGKNRRISPSMLEVYFPHRPPLVVVFLSSSFILKGNNSNFFSPKK